MESLTSHNSSDLPHHPGFLKPVDIAAVVIYFILVICIGFYATYRSNRGTTTGYFLAGKSINWFLVGSSLLASNVGAPSFIALAGGAAASGIAITIYEWHAVFMLILLGWIFVPVYTASGCITMPEYLKKRYGGTRLRTYLSLLSLVMYILTKISAEIYAGALFIQVLLDWDLYFSIILIMSVTALYTITGGLTAVIYTDTLQAIIVIISASIVSIMGLVKVGGWGELKTKYLEAATNRTWQDFHTFRNHSCGLPRNDSFHIFRDPVNSDLPWTGAVFGLTPVALWVWCTDQLMVQRTLSAKNITHAKGGALFAAYLKILPFFLFVIPGMISRILYTDKVACSTPDSCYAVCRNKDGCSNIAYPLLVLKLLPDGIRGIMLAALLAALMSSLTSIFNSASSMFTLDVYKQLRRRASETELLIIGRVFIICLVGASIAWIPILQKSEGGVLWDYLQAISSYIAPPWCVVFVAGVFWTRTTEQGAFWGLMAGLFTGTIRMILDFYYKSITPPCGSGLPNNVPSIVRRVHYLHFSILLTGICTIVTIVVSLCTPARPAEKLRRRTWWTRNETEDMEDSDVSAESDYEPCNQDEHEIFINTNTDDTSVLQTENTIEEESLVFLIQERKSWLSTIWSFLLKWLCGFEPEKKRRRQTKAERLKEHRILTSINETTFWKWFLNVNAVICIAVTCALLGIFG